MFDYQAGEKYRLTLIMTGLAGLIAGMFFTVLLMPTPEPVHHRSRPQYMNNPDINGRSYTNSQTSAAGAAVAMSGMTDPTAAAALIQQWLPLAWDLSAGTAGGSQEKAIAYMTPECADAYRQNIWSPEIAKQIDDAGVKSTFHADNVQAGSPLSDGGVVVSVDGTQTLTVPTGSSKERMVKLEYMVRQTPEGLRIAGISEGGQGN